MNQTEDSGKEDITHNVIKHHEVVGEVASQDTEEYAALKHSTQHSDSAEFIEFILRMILDATPRAQSKAQIGAQSASILHALTSSPLSANEILVHINLRSKTGAFKRAIKTLLSDGLIEYTLPDRPNSRLQKYRLSAKGRSRINA